MTILPSFSPLHAPTVPATGGPNYLPRLDYLSIMGITFVSIFFVICLSCYISSLLRKRNILSALGRASRESQNIEEWPCLILTDPEKKNLITWLRRASLGRFAGTDLEVLHAVQPPTPEDKPQYHAYCYNTPFPSPPSPSFSPYRIYASPSFSMSPDMDQPLLLSSPQGTFPGSFTHLGFGAPLQAGNRPPPFSFPKVFVPAHRTSLRSISVPTAVLRARQTVQRFVSENRFGNSNYHAASSYRPIPSPEATPRISASHQFEQGLGQKESVGVY